MRLCFSKMNGLGNDFIVVDARIFPVDQIVRHTKRLCSRQFGIGADGIIFILPGENGSAFTMRIINSDGSEAEMCGNGIRCFAHWLVNNGEFNSEELTVNTPAGMIRITRKSSAYRVNMGKPVLNPAEIPIQHQGKGNVALPISVSGQELQFTGVSMGNPHAVFFTDDITDEQVLNLGPIIEKDKLFPHRTNVEFIRVISPNEIQMRVWERGCGETMACGTGACAAMVAGVLNGFIGHKVTVHLKGGRLLVEWNGKKDSPVFITGEADTVFTGEITLQ